MRKIIQTFYALCFVIACLAAQAQDFSVSCSSPYIGGGYFKPTKAGGSFQFQVKIKNNKNVTCTVSIDANA